MSDGFLHTLSIVASGVAAVIGTLLGILFHGLRDELTSANLKADRALRKIATLRGFIAGKYGGEVPGGENGED